MAGGVYSSMNKVRPGAYINYKTESQLGNIVGARGIATLATSLSWGAEGSLIELTGADLVNGDSLAKIGLMANEAEALIFKLALQNCAKLKIFKLNTGGTKATTTLENGLVVTAKHNGTFGNKIAVLIKVSNNSYIVETYADGYQVDSQKVAGIPELVSNDFVEFSGSGTLADTSSTLLEGGTDGTIETLTTAYSTYLDLLRNTKWSTMAVLTDDTSVNSTIVDFIEEIREDEGKYVQAVLANYASANYEGIINNVNGVVLEDGTEISALDFTAWVAGATAGADMAESLTGKIVEGAATVVGLLKNADIIDGLNKGQFILSLNQNGSIKVEKDINSLHNFNEQKGYTFSKNRVIRELDEIGSSIQDIWETTYLGKVSNNEGGRTLFKSSIIRYLTELQNRGAIQDFDSDSVSVIAGDDIDSVIASIAVKPVDSMEFLYMTVNVEQ